MVVVAVVDVVAAVAVVVVAASMRVWGAVVQPSDRPPSFL